MKGAVLILISALALAQSEETIEVNAVGCPLDFEVQMLLPHETYCNLFYSCLVGTRIQQNCPAGLVFNEDEGYCDWTINVDCGSKGIYELESEEDDNDSEAQPGGNADPSAAPEICAQSNSDGILVAHENCNQFYKCVNGKPDVTDCQPGLFYNYNYGYCDWPYNVECEDRIIPSDK